MKLINKDIQNKNAGLLVLCREWWSLSGGYEVLVDKGSKVCSFWISDLDKKDITFDIAKLLKLDVSEKQLTTRNNKGKELYVTMSINCIAINYTKIENYKDMLEKIEAIINEYIKNK